jgi:EPS-associated MarR family transcriptional regulator
MDETHFNTLRELARDGSLSQRELSRRMGLSLGRVNYVVNALLKKGFIKARRFKNAKNKIAYMYVLTPKGISTKLTHTYGFLQRKLEEFERLKKEIEMLRRETDQVKSPQGTASGLQFKGSNVVPDKGDEKHLL